MSAPVECPFPKEYPFPHRHFTCHGCSGYFCTRTTPEQIRREQEEHGTDLGPPYVHVCDACYTRRMAEITATPDPR